jgi:cardiolipin synthase
MDWLQMISRFWPHLVAGFGTLATVLASIHVLLHKRDSRAATLWIGLIWLLPIFGPMLYLVFGINRIRRRAVSLGMHKISSRPIPVDLGEAEAVEAHHLQQLARVVGHVVGQPLTPGTKVQPLVNGDEAFPAMLAAIDSATKSIAFTTYIFDNDPSGKQFVGALERAVKRGVEVRVLIDDAGTRYSWPPITHRLKHARVPFAKFLPASLLTPWRVTTINLRNHRKLLVIDGQAAFTGGMNIRHGNVLADSPKGAVQDLQFRVEGPIVTRLQEAFVNDWAFTTGEKLEADIWFPELKEVGDVIARVITDGPDEDFDKFRWALLGALSEAQTSIQILTPYFLPDTALATALNLAAMRGVRVDIVLPAKNNLPFVHWASRAMWSDVLERGCHLWLTPPPFDHSKLMIVDSHWVLLGSANWDARSLQLNFELNLECYGHGLAGEMEAVIQRKLQGAQEVTLTEVSGRSLATKLRDAAARLFAPYL